MRNDVVYLSTSDHHTAGIMYTEVVRAQWIQLKKDATLTLPTRAVTTLR